LIDWRVEWYRRHLRILIFGFKIIFFLIKINIIKIRLNLNLKSVNTAMHLRDAYDSHVEQNNRRCKWSVRSAERKTNSFFARRRISIADIRRSQFAQ
jgi:hypothetical protein